MQTLVARYGAQYEWAKSIGIKATLESLNYDSTFAQSSPMSSLESLSDSMSTQTAQLAKRQSTFNKTQCIPHFCGTAIEIYSEITSQISSQP